jgi:5-methylcytosine-specific restriction protein A
MPRKRQPIEVWRETRLKVLTRDNFKCARCGKEVTEKTAHIDHIKSGKLGTNELSNLRTLCIICHATRSDHRHQGLTARLVRSGELPPDWRKLVWDDD